VKTSAQVLPLHLREYIPHAMAHALAVQRGASAGEEVRGTVHSWLTEIRTFFSDICQTEERFSAQRPRSTASIRMAYFPGGVLVDRPSENTCFSYLGAPPGINLALLPTKGEARHGSLNTYAQVSHRWNVSRRILAGPIW
jgi:hypothetical protein